MSKVNPPRKPAGGSRLSELLARRAGEAAPDTTVGRGGGIAVKGETEDVSVASILDSHRYQGRPPRLGEHLHVSDLVGKCMRRTAIIYRMKLSPQSRGLNLSDSLTFAQGDAIHDALRERLVTASPESAYGRWGCRCGTTVTEKPSLFTEVPATMTCPACKTGLTKYHEVTVRNEEFKITGNPDYLLYRKATKSIMVVELKSMTHEMWKDLARPLPEHVLQTAFYWDLLSRDGYRMGSHASILYATKAYVFRGSPVKEMLVDMAALTAGGRLEPYYASAAQVKAARVGGPLPDRVCQSQEQTSAKNCDVCVQCFGVSDNVSSPKTISFREAIKRPAAKDTGDGAGPVAKQHGGRVLRRR